MDPNKFMVLSHIYKSLFPKLNPGVNPILKFVFGISTALFHTNEPEL